MIPRDSPIPCEKKTTKNNYNKTSPDEKEKISIIIPAYNSGKYIETTLNNLFVQTYQNFEIIISYDEKSADNSLELLQNINKIHPIRIDIGTDTGPGTSRNRGLHLAEGEYVIFVDADDEIHPQYLETMINIFRNHPELNVVSCNYFSASETDTTKWQECAEDTLENYSIYSREEALYHVLWNDIADTPWAHLVKRQYIVENNIRFPDYSYGEDAYYVHQLFGNTDKIGFSHRKLYKYIQHPTSITSTFTKESRWNKHEKSRADIINYFSKIDPIYAEDYLTKRIRAHVYTCVLLYDCKTFIAEMKKQNITKLSMLKRHDRLPYQLSVICYSVSKRLFYYLARFTAGRMKSLTPMGQKLEG